MSNKKVKGCDLVFISRISGDGQTIKILTVEEANEVSSCPIDKYKLSSLSISNGTYIASSINSYVVKLKK